MKQSLTFLFLSFLFITCSTTKLVRTSQKDLKGNWILSSITTNQGNIVAIKTLFDQAPPDCFENSKWSFVSNNNSGTYHFQNANCDDSIHSIKWLMEENDNEVYFLWKFIPEGMKPKDVKIGYKLKLLSQSETEFVLAQDVPFEGDIVTIFYKFIKYQG